MALGLRKPEKLEPKPSSAEPDKRLIEFVADGNDHDAQESPARSLQDKVHREFVGVQRWPTRHEVATFLTVCLACWLAMFTLLNSI